MQLVLLDLENGTLRTTVIKATTQSVVNYPGLESGGIRECAEEGWDGKECDRTSHLH